MKEKLKLAIREFELPLLAFPIIVTCIVALGFIFKCPCSVKEWWMAVALTIGLIWYRGKDKQVSAIVTAMFMTCLGVLWIATNASITYGWADTLTYHQPAIRMLANGWNPVWQGTPDKIQKSIGIANDMVGVWHIIAMPKGIWYFCSAAYAFTGAHFNLLFPLAPIMLTLLVYTIYTTFRTYGKSLAVCACLIVIYFLRTGYAALIDHVVEICTVGLLLTMANCLREGKWPWERLMAFSFWMIVAKQISLLHCALFWIVFVMTLALARKVIPVKRLFGIASVFLMLFLVINCSPYITSAVNFRHPLYPKYSTDIKSFPIKDLTKDFFYRNEDAAAMGHIGAYVNAFVSSSIAKTYYSRKTGNVHFHPYSQTWKQQEGEAWLTGSPTRIIFKWLYCASILLLCAFGGVPGVFFSICIVLGCLTLPTEMIGYLRYTPWALSGFPLGVMALLCSVKQKSLRNMLSMFAAAVLLLAGMRFVLDCAINVDAGYAIRISLKCNPPTIMSYEDDPLRTFHSDRDKRISGNLFLLRKCVPQLALSEIVFNLPSNLELEMWKPYFDNSFYVAPEYEMSQYSERQKILLCPNR